MCVQFNEWHRLRDLFRRSGIARTLCLRVRMDNSMRTCRNAATIFRTVGRQEAVIIANKWFHLKDPMTWREPIITNRNDPIVASQSEEKHTLDQKRKQSKRHAKSTFPLWDEPFQRRRERIRTYASDSCTITPSPCLVAWRNKAS